MYLPSVRSGAAPSTWRLSWHSSGMLPCGGVGSSSRVEPSNQPAHGKTEREVEVEVERERERERETERGRGRERERESQRERERERDR